MKPLVLILLADTWSSCQQCATESCTSAQASTSANERKSRCNHPVTSGTRTRAQSPDGTAMQAEPAASFRLKPQQSVNTLMSSAAGKCVHTLQLPTHPCARRGRLMRGEQPQQRAASQGNATRCVPSPLSSSSCCHLLAAPALGGSRRRPSSPSTPHHRRRAGPSAPADTMRAPAVTAPPPRSPQQQWEAQRTRAHASGATGDSRSV